MIPELAALVSQKFTFSVSISTKNLTQRNVSFQVNGIVTFFGKQAHTPKPAELSYDRGGAPSPVMLLEAPVLARSAGSTPAKGPRLDRKVIPCRKSLSFGTSNNPEETPALGDKDASVGAGGKAELDPRPRAVDSSSIPAEEASADDVVDVAPHERWKQSWNHPAWRQAATRQQSQESCALGSYFFCACCAVQDHMWLVSARIWNQNCFCN